MTTFSCTTSLHSCVGSSTRLQLRHDVSDDAGVDVDGEVVAMALANLQVDRGLKLRLMVTDKYGNGQVHGDALTMS